MTIQIKKQLDVDTLYQQLFFCQLKIKDIPIIPQNIINLTIREWVFELTPRLELMFNDDGLFTEVYTLEDNDKIEVLLGRYPDDENPIKAEFLLQDYKVNPVADNKCTIISVSGIINSTSLFTPIQNRAFSNRTSKDVISFIANECGLTFKNGDNFRTNDSMTWLQINQNNFDFIKHVNQRSFVENDCVLIFINHKKELWMTSLELETQKKEFRIARFDLLRCSNLVFDNKEDERTIWFNSYDLVNLQGFFNKTNNYGVKVNWFDQKEKKTLEINKKQPYLTKKTFKNSFLNGQITKLYNYGIENNVFKNYFKAKVQNKYLMENFFSNSLIINVNPINKVNLLDKLYVVIPSIPGAANNELNKILSGEYLVGGIVYSVSKGGTMLKQVSLHRDGFNTNDLNNIYRNG